MVSLTFESVDKIHSKLLSSTMFCMVLFVFHYFTKQKGLSWILLLVASGNEKVDENRGSRCFATAVYGSMVTQAGK